MLRLRRYGVYGDFAMPRIVTIFTVAVCLCCNKSLTMLTSLLIMRLTFVAL